ncbi:hypothetical protein [Radiobacillus sp. PE A8.2]|uniref:hypothetical protein n=1 Tax=Radiobacillus sp. PE A8.2 TaxID=3380349 RepID=UPI00388D0F5D
MSDLNQNLKKAFDNYIGLNTLVKDEDKERFYMRINKKKKHINWIPRLATVIGVIILVLGVYIAYDSSMIQFVEDTDIVTIEDKTVDYPEQVKAKIAELPKDVQHLLTVPTIFPSDPKSITFRVDRNADDQILSTQFSYGGSVIGWGLHVTTWYQEFDSNGKNPDKIVTLNSGAEAELRGDNSSKSIEWTGKDDLRHQIMIMELKSKTTFDDLINIANSME